MGVKTVKRSDTERRKTRSRVECPRKQKTTQETATVGYYHPFAAAKKIPAMQISMHKHIHARTDNPRNADSNWSSCAFSVERESEEWYKEEFQISKTIFHFPPSAGISDLTFCESTQHLRHIHRLTQLICYRYRVSVLHLNWKQGQMLLFYMLGHSRSQVNT